MSRALQPNYDFTHVKAKPRLLEKVPGIGKTTAQTIYPNIYLPAHILQDLQSLSPSFQNSGLLLHEQIHLARAKSYGILKYYLRMVFSRKFRFEEELIAYRAQCMYLKNHKTTIDLAKIAKNLSGPLYGWSTSYDNALNRLNQMWDDLA